MKMGVEQPEQLVDINRLDLTKVEELPNNGGVRDRRARRAIPTWREQT